ncbi:hypothetical protein IZU99_03205 [Oscillospiraceae bacterium CM]|nr:hypothetical protein IZU99_03205 [Oscillospiraceae bacterium CM]
MPLSFKLCVGAYFAATMCVLYAFGLFIPAFGTISCTVGTFLMALAGILLGKKALNVYVTAGAMLCVISPRYAAEFLMTTGFVGLILGIDANKRRAFFLATAGMLFGLLAMTYLIGSATFGLALELPVYSCIPIYTVFSASYSALWLVIIPRLKTKAFFRICRYAPDAEKEAVFRPPKII